MKTYLLVILILLSGNVLVLSQNLVYNPSFEEQYSCPDNFGQIWKAIGWKNLGYTPDLLSACANPSSYGVPYNQYDYQNAANGNSYAGSFQYWEGVTDVREYIGTRLITPLQQNTKYFVSMKVSPACPAVPTSGVFINNLGFLFTNHIYDSTHTGAMNRYHVKCNNIISDTLNWTVIKGSFIADSNYSHLIIGNLLDDAHTLIDSSMSPPHIYIYTAYYFIDNVCVTSDSLFNENYIAGFINDYNLNDKILIYPNPANNYISIKNNAEDEILNIEIISIYGEVIKRIINISNMLDISYLRDGLYFLRINFYEKKQIIKSFLKIN
jgi:OmpA-OmpF porin, OOP family